MDATPIDTELSVVQSLGSGSYHDSPYIRLHYLILHLMVNSFSLANLFTLTTIGAHCTVETALGFRDGCFFVKAQLNLIKLFSSPQLKSRHGVSCFRFYPLLRYLFYPFNYFWSSLLHVYPSEVAVN